MMLFEAFLYDIIIFTCKYSNQHYTRLCAGPRYEVQRVHLEKSPPWNCFQLVRPHVAEAPPLISEVKPQIQVRQSVPPLVSMP